MKFTKCCGRRARTSTLILATVLSTFGFFAATGCREYEPQDPTDVFTGLLPDPDLPDIPDIPNGPDDPILGGSGGNPDPYADQPGQVRVTIQTYDPGNPLAVRFRANSADGTSLDASRLVWDFGDGTVEAGSEVTHSYPAEGDYYVALEAGTPEETARLTSFFWDTVVQIRRFRVTIFASPQQGPVPLTVQFTSQVVLPWGQEAVMYLWDMGTEEWVEGGPTATHTFTEPGTYQIRLKVVTDLGWQRTGWFTLEVLEGNNPPTAQIEGGPLAGQAPLTVLLDGSKSSDPDGDAIVSYEWNFGDGSTASGPVVSHVYETAGKYTVTLTVTDEAGATGQRQVAVQVEGPPEAAFTIDAPSHVAPCVVILDATASRDGDGNIVSYRWDFGDGQAVEGPTLVKITHGYSVGGSYTVTLTVTDDDGNTASAQASLHMAEMVLEPTSLDFGDSEVSQIIQIANPGSASLPYNVDIAYLDGSGGWLSVTPTSDTCPAGESRQLTVTASRDSLAPGSHTAEINVTAGGVTKTVVASIAVAAVAVSVDNLYFGPGQTTGQFEIWNAGAGTLEYQVACSAPWVTIENGTGTSTGGDDRNTVTITVDPTGLSAGTHTAQIQISPGGLVIPLTTEVPGTGAYIVPLDTLTMVSDDFESGMDGWTGHGGGSWSVISDVTAGSNVLDLSGSFSPGANGTLGAYAILDAADVGDFVLTGRFRSTSTAAWRDLAVVFGYQDSTHYYAVFFNALDDNDTNGIFRVDPSGKTEISPTGIPGVLTDMAWHDFLIYRQGNTIAVYFDGSLAFTAKDSTYGTGKIGLGSLNDTGRFDDLRLWRILENEPLPAQPLTVALFGYCDQPVGALYHWDLGDGTTAETQLVTHTYATEGQHTVTLTVSYGPGQATGQLTLTTAPAPLTAYAGSDKAIVAGQSVALNGAAAGGQPPYSYSWSPGTGLSATNVATPTASPSTTTTYTLTVTDSAGQSATDTVVVTVTPKALTSLSISGPSTVAEGATAAYSATATYNDGSSGDVTGAASWSILDGPGSINSQGLYTAPASVQGTTPVTIQVRYSEGGVTKTVSKSITVFAAGSGAGWTPPVGIPAPAFGITQTVESVYGSADYFTHYVDNTHPAATDSNNPYGTPDKPRRTLPAVLPAGSVVEIHGGPYTYATAGDKIVVEANGTASQPVFIRGRSASERPVFTTKILPQGRYVIFENLTMDNVGFDIRPYNGGTIDTFAIRHCEIAGDGSPGSGAAIMVSDTYDAVIYDNEIHHNGDASGGTENDRHGVSLGGGCTRIWVVDNNIHHNGGDSFQTKGGSDHIYVGRNLMHEDRENAVDIKEAYDVVASQNVMYGYVPTDSSDGAVVGMHYDPQRIWIIYNTIYDGQFGISSSGADDVYCLGNVIYNIKPIGGDSHAPNSAYRAGAAIRAYNSGALYAYNNTIYDVALGIGLQMLSSSRVEIVNNIIADVDEALTGYHIIVNGNSTGIANSTMSHNLLYQSSGSVRISWDDSTYTFETFVNGVPGVSGFGAGCIQADPRFAGAAAGDFHLLGTSPAIDAGIVPGPAATFYNLYGIGIEVDRDGEARPQNSGYDMGAFEWVSGQ